MVAIATSDPARVARRRAARTLLSEYALLCLTLVVIFVLVYPTSWIFIASFRTPETMFAVRGWAFTIDNYVHLLGSALPAQSLTASSFVPAASRSGPSSWSSGLCAFAVALSRQALPLRCSDAGPDLPPDHPGDATLHPVRAARSSQ